MTIDRALIVAAANDLGAVLLPDTDQWQHRLQIRSSSSTMLYIVAQRKTGETAGEWGCSCMGWKSHRHCKHLANMLPALRALERPASPIRGR